MSDRLTDRKRSDGVTNPVRVQSHKGKSSKGGHGTGQKSVQPLATEQTGKQQTQEAIIQNKSEQGILVAAQASEALTKSESTLRSIFLASPVGIMFISSDRRITLMNQRMTAITGYSLEDLADASPRIFYPTEEEFARVGAIIGEKIRRGVTAEADTTWVRKDGAVRDIHLSLAPIDPGDPLGGAVSTVIDVTEQKEAEKKLLESEERYRTAIEHSNDGVAITAQDQYIYVNQKFLEMFGYDKPKEIIGESPLVVVHPEDRARILGYGARRREGRPVPDRYEYKGMKKDGTVISVEASTTETVYRGEPMVLAYLRDITERKRAEKALKQSEERFRALVEKSSEVIILYDRNSERTYVSPAVTRVLGYSAEEYLSLDRSELVHPDDLLSTERARLSIRPGETITTVCRLRHKDGNWRWTERTMSNLLDEPGIQSMVANIRDITERKAAEEALHESENKFRDLAEKSPAGIYIIQDNAFKYINNKFAQICGYSVDEIIGGKTSQDFVFLEPVPPLEQGAAAGSSGPPVSSGHEFRIITPTQGTRYIEVHSSHTMFEGRPASIGTIIDVTERKLIEEALRESEINYRNVVENSLVGVAIVQDNVYHFANKRFCEIHGYTREELAGKMGPSDFVHPDDLKMVEENVRKRLADETARIEYDLKAIRKDGRIVTLKALGSTTVYNGRPAAMVSVIDITKEKVLETQLFQAQKMEAIGTLAGGIAHDFNNILTAIIGYGNLLQMQMGKDDPLRVYVGHMLSSSEKAANLTQNLLAFSRRQIIELKPIKINTILDSMERLLRRLLTEDIELKLIPSEKNVTVMADISQMDQILLNLATNARDAMPHGGKLTIELREVELNRTFLQQHGYGEPGLYALISVGDTGFGMNAKTVEKIFEPFFTTKEVGKGTGLGLSIVYGIVKQHHGYITVYSEPEVGTSFNIYIPSVKAAAQEKEVKSPAVEGGTETILVAEDEVMVRNLTRTILSQAGYTVIEATDGENAVEKFMENKDAIALAFLDVVMPRKNGKEAYEEMRRVKADLKVLFTSGYTGDVVIDKGILEKEYNFIQKPIVPDDLLSKIRTILDR